MTDSVTVRYEGDQRLKKADRRPYPVPGHPEPWQPGEEREITDDWAQTHFRVSAKDHTEYLFGENGVLNANLLLPRFVIVEPKPKREPKPSEKDEGAAK